MNKGVTVVLAVGCGAVAVLWAAFNLHRAFAPDIVTDRPIAYPSSWVDVPEFVLLVVLVGLLRVNVSLAPLAARHGKAAERCRIAHFWATVGCIGIAIGYGATFRFWEPVDVALYAPPPGLAVLEACLLPIQVLFAGCVLAVVSDADVRHMASAPGAGYPRARPRLVRNAAAAIGSPVAGACVVTFLVVALLTDVWWNWRVPAGWGLQEWRRVGALVAAALAFIGGIGSRNALAALSSIIVGIVAGTTWVFWTFPNDTGFPPVLSVLWGVLTSDWWELSAVFAGAGTGAVFATVVRHVYLKKGTRVTAR